MLLPVVASAFPVRVGAVSTDKSSLRHYCAIVCRFNSYCDRAGAVKMEFFSFVLFWGGTTGGTGDLVWAGMGGIEYARGGRGCRCFLLRTFPWPSLGLPLAFPWPSLPPPPSSCLGYGYEYKNLLENRLTLS